MSCRKVHPLPRRWRQFGLVGLASVSLSGTAHAAVPVVKPEIVAVHPHDRGAFTQGLLLHAGNFFESTGQYGRSSLREVTPATGVVLRRVDLDRQFFGEGLALVDERLVQLTWQNELAFVFDLKTFKQLKTFDYEGEGWGLCYDGKRLVMSDGSGSLFFRDKTTFEVTGKIAVTLDGKPTTRLNELECVGKLVYANVWQTPDILRIDPASGKVLTRIDATELVNEQVGTDVLNGIAYDPQTKHFFITGKLWPKMYETRFSFAPGNADPAPAQTDAAAPAPAKDAAGGATKPKPGEASPPTTKTGDASPEAAKTEDASSSKPTAPTAETAKTDRGACDCRLEQRRRAADWWAPLLAVAGLLLRRRS